MRGDIAYGYELDIVTMALLGGVSIFGGSGTLFGVFLSILIILNIRNGMSLLSLSGHFQNGVIGVLLILSVLGPNLVNDARIALNRRRFAAGAGGPVTVLIGAELHGLTARGPQNDERHSLLGRAERRSKDGQNRPRCSCATVGFGCSIPFRRRPA